MNGFLWFIAPVALNPSAVMVVAALIAGIALNWGRARG